MTRPASVILDDTQDKEKQTKLKLALKQEKSRLDDLRRDEEDEVRTHDKNMKHYTKERTKCLAQIAKIEKELGLSDTPSSEATAGTQTAAGKTSGALSNQ